MSSLRWKDDSGDPHGISTWRVELIFALPIALIVFYLIYVWFAVRDRYLIFLYFHDMGPGFDTTPFGWVTVSRYWMSGLVASGAVMFPYLAINFLLGRFLNSFRAPEWWRVWLLCAIPLLIAVPAIVMTANVPALPLANALQVTAATLIGLAVVVRLGGAAAGRPVDFMLLMVDGFGLACLLSSLPRFESYSRWVSRGSISVIQRHLAVLIVGVGLLAAMTAFRWWRRLKIPRARDWFVANLVIKYLFLPLYHHLFWCSDDGSWTDADYFSYMPDADNYFSRNLLIQLGAWLAVALIALGLTRLRLGLRRRRQELASG